MTLVYMRAGVRTYICVCWLLGCEAFSGWAAWTGGGGGGPALSARTTNALRMPGPGSKSIRDRLRAHMCWLYDTHSRTYGRWSAAARGGKEVGGGRRTDLKAFGRLRRAPALGTRGTDSNFPHACMHTTHTRTHTHMNIAMAYIQYMLYTDSDFESN